MDSESFRKYSQLLISTSVQRSFQRDNRRNIESYVNSKVREIREGREKSRESDEHASRPYTPWTFDLKFIEVTTSSAERLLSLGALEKFARSCKVLETIPARAGIRRRRFCIESAGTAKVFAFHYHAARFILRSEYNNIYVLYIAIVKMIKYKE